jgi:hypothetical protein
MEATMRNNGNLLNKDSDQIVVINGREVGTEEAALVFNALAVDERALFQGLTDLKVIEAIYSLWFDYGFSNTHGVPKFNPMIFSVEGAI